MSEAGGQGQVYDREEGRVKESGERWNVEVAVALAPAVDGHVHEFEVVRG